MKYRHLLASLALITCGLTAMPTSAADAATTVAPTTQKSEAPENKVKLEDCPKAVQDTIKKEVSAGKIEEIAKETEDGKTTYEVDAKIDGKDYEIKVAEDGTLISKKLDADEKEEGDKDQKGHHEDKK